MRYQASAPGKLVLLGEYSVLEGGEAVVIAVDRRVQTSLMPSDKPGLSLSLKPLLRTPVHIHIHDGELVLAPPHQAETELVRYVLRALGDRGLLNLETLQGWLLEVDSSALFFEDEKLGLGSSAAVTVALCGLLCAFSGRTDDCDLSLLMSIHHGFQGSGSGLDVATSFLGGVVAFRKSAHGPEVEKLATPKDQFNLLAVWSGSSASTKQFIAKLNSYASNQPQRFHTLMTEMKASADKAVEALKRRDSIGFVQYAQNFNESLRSLDHHGQLGVVTRAHEQIGEIMDFQNSVYKTCGAGGGDLGVLISLDAETQKIAQQRLTAKGYESWPVVPGSQGLELTVG